MAIKDCVHILKCKHTMAFSQCTDLCRRLSGLSPCPCKSSEHSTTWLHIPYRGNKTDFHRSTQLRFGLPCRKHTTVYAIPNSTFRQDLFPACLQFVGKQYNSWMAYLPILHSLPAICFFTCSVFKFRIPVLSIGKRGSLCSISLFVIQTQKFEEGFRA